MTGRLAGQLALAAETLMGSPFRLHGRDPATGIDCVGVVILSLRTIGICVDRLPGYALRQMGYDVPEQVIEQAGFRAARGAALPGDLLLVRPGPAQLHLVIAARGNCAIHAHAGLGRVVATPLPLPWPILRKWRLSELE